MPFILNEYRYVIDKTITIVIPIATTMYGVYTSYFESSKDIIIKQQIEDKRLLQEDKRLLQEDKRLLQETITHLQLQQIEDKRLLQETISCLKQKDEVLYKALHQKRSSWFPFFN